MNSRHDIEIYTVSKSRDVGPFGNSITVSIQLRNFTSRKKKENFSREYFFELFLLIRVNMPHKHKRRQKDEA